MSLIGDPDQPWMRQRYGGPPTQVIVFKTGAAAVCDASGVNVLRQPGGAVLFADEESARQELARFPRNLSVAD